VALSHISEFEEDVHDVEAAIPAIKSGFKTSEGILTLVSIVGSQAIIYFAPTLSPGVATALSIASAALGVAYTFNRQILKSNQIKASALVAAHPDAVSMALKS
jgi:hypothetical protein